MYEGAVRVPCVIQWKGQIQPGLVSNEMMCGLDLYPTLAAMVGASDKIPTDQPIDGIDQSALLLGKQEHSNRDYVYYFLQNDLYAIKLKKFKIHFKYFERSRYDSFPVSTSHISGSFFQLFDCIRRASSS